jgi:hypothetical protein
MATCGGFVVKTPSEAAHENIKHTHTIFRFFCTVHFVNVNKRPTKASSVIQYNSIFFHSYMLRYLKCHLQGVY